MSSNTPYDFPDMTAETMEIWNTNAEWWDDQIGDGNDFQIHLIEPSTLHIEVRSHNETARMRPSVPPSQIGQWSTSMLLVASNARVGPGSMAPLSA